MPWSYPDFVHVMHIYMVSHALFQATCEDTFKRHLRTHYSTIGQLASSSSKYQEELHEVVCRHGKHMLDKGLHDAWAMNGNLAGMSGNEVSVTLKDDSVLKACFFAQVLWMCASDDLTKNIVAMSILSGSPHRQLESHVPLFSRHVHDILNVLKACPEYVFKACPGFDIVLHLTHIRSQEKYEENCQDGCCPFKR